MGAADHLSRVQVNDLISGDEEELATHITPFDLNDLEPQLHVFSNFLKNLSVEGFQVAQRVKVKSNSWNFLAWEGKLFRRTVHGLRLVVQIASRQNILRSFHDNIGHWDAKPAGQFILEMYSWPKSPKEILSYDKSCAVRQKASPVPKYRTTLRLSIINLFEVFCIDFAGPVPTTGGLETVFF